MADADSHGRMPPRSGGASSPDRTAVLGVRMPQKIMEFLAHKIVSNVRELEGALNRITAQMQLIGRDITLESAQDVLHDLVRANERRVTIDEIQKRVAEHFNIKLAEMTSSRRARVVARPRQVAMYLAKQLTTLSLPQIGKRFGNRDHTTVMHAVRKIEELKISDLSIAECRGAIRRWSGGCRRQGPSRAASASALPAPPFRRAICRRK